MWNGKRRLTVVLIGSAIYETFEIIYVVIFFGG